MYFSIVATYVDNIYVEEYIILQFCVLLVATVNILGNVAIIIILQATTKN